MSAFNPYPKPFRPSKEKVYFIPKMSKKREQKVKLEKLYYAQVIEDKRSKDGKCYCEECEVEIKMPKGKNVSHIISKGANPALYMDDRNNCLLCESCHWGYEFGDRTVMKIYERTEKIREELNLEYYQG